MSSRREDLSLKVFYLKNSWSAKKIREELIDLFDMDDNGDNEDEYLMDEAKAEGFETNAEYFINEHAGKTGKISDIALSNIVEESLRDNNFYAEREIDITKVPDGRILVVANTSGC